VVDLDIAFKDIAGSDVFMVIVTQKYLRDVDAFGQWELMKEVKI